MTASCLDQNASASVKLPSTLTTEATRSGAAIRVARCDHAAHRVANQMHSRIRGVSLDQSTHALDSPFDCDLRLIIHNGRAVPMQVWDQKRCGLEHGKSSSVCETADQAMYEDESRHRTRIQYTRTAKRRGLRLIQGRG